MTTSKYHQPVLLHESVDGLITDTDGVYVDATFGGGGHSQAIMERLGNGHLVGFDKDPDAEVNAPDAENFTFVNHDFIYMRNYLRYFELLPVTGILADLGVSSRQIDNPERGFAHRYNAQLDMRMDPDSRTSAFDVVNHYTEEKLIRIFRDYGELRNARKIAAQIIHHRNEGSIKSTEKLASIISEVMPSRKEVKFLSMAFQAIRLEVNSEIDRLKKFLHEALKILKPEGRLAVIAYHSLEDRVVKRFFATGNFEGIPNKDEKGNLLRPFEPVTRKPIKPAENEIEENPRARSARLRIAKKTDYAGE